jgi:hypothetical protein
VASERSQIVGEQIVRLAIEELVARLPKKLADEAFVRVPEALKAAIPKAAERIEALSKED